MTENTAGLRIPTLFAPGQVLKGDATQYEIGGEIGSGAYGRTFNVIPADPSKVGADRAVLKSPKLDPARGPEDNAQRIGELNAALSREFAAMQRLGDLDCVAGVLDLAHARIDIGHGQVAPGFCLIYEFVEGDNLADWFRIRRPAPKRGFDEDCFFKWARELAQALRRVHGRMVAHGDVWPANIMVTADEKLVLIDFGQAFFRDNLMPQDGQQGTHAYVAPEKKGGVAGDVFSLGAVLFYLATGDEPPPSITRERDNASLKNRVIFEVATRNPDLHRQNPGIADVIARCLRQDPSERTRGMPELLLELDLFSPEPKSSNGAKPRFAWIPFLGSAAPSEVEVSNPVFSSLHRTLQARLDAVREDMASGVYDLWGEHDELVIGLSLYLRMLGAGDVYGTISLPSFWADSNLGYRGRFLSMNQLAAQRQASIRRVFILRQRDLSDPQVLQILSAHVAVREELRAMDVNVDDRTDGTPGYWVGQVIVSDEEFEAIPRQRHHFGMIRREGGQVWVFPVYRDPGTLVGLHFRARDGEHVKLTAVYHDYLSRAEPLAPYNGEIVL